MWDQKNIELTMKKASKEKQASQKKMEQTENK